jgi:WD40 repeat protein
MSSDGKYIAATGGKNVYLFPRQSNVPLWNYTTEGYARYVAMSSDGSYIAAGDSAGRVYFFSRGSGTPVWLYASNPKGIKLVAVSGDGNYVLVSRIGSVQLQSSNGTLLWDFPFFRVDGAALSSAGDAVLGTSDGLYLFSPQRELIREYNISGSDIGPVAISADGNYIAVVGSSGVFLLERGSINPLWKYDTSIVSEQVAMSADGSYIFAARHDGVVYLFSREAHEGAPGQAAGETGTPAGATEGAAPQQPGTQDGSSSGDNAAPSQSSSATDGKTSANPSEPQQLPIMWLGLGAAAVIIVVAAVALKLRKPGSGQPAVYTGERNRPDM